MCRSRYRAGVQADINDVVERSGPEADLAPVEQQTRLLLLDTLACAIAGLRHPQVSALVNGCAPGHHSFPGLGRTVSAVDAARLLTVAACWDEFCEGHQGARGRPGLHSVGPAVALAADADLEAVLSAVIAGYNTGARYGAAWLTLSGLHVDGSWGVSAAAASAARAMGLAPDQAVQAVRIAASMPGANLYATVPVGATSRNLFAAEAVARGMDSAQAAAAGITGPPGAVGAAMDVLSRTAPAPAFADQPIRDGYLKAWPCVRHTHYAIVAAQQWREQFGSTPGPITLDMHVPALEYAGVRAPTNLLQAQFSSTWCAAYALVHGQVDLDAFAHLDDPEVAEVESRLELVSGTIDAGRWACLSSPVGEVLITELPGDPGRPLTTDEVRHKALALAGERLGSSAPALADFILDAPLSSPWRDCPGMV